MRYERKQVVIQFFKYCLWQNDFCYTCGTIPVSNETVKEIKKEVNLECEVIYLLTRF